MDGTNDRRHRESDLTTASNEDWWHPTLAIFERDHRATSDASGPLEKSLGHQQLSEAFQKMRETSERLCVLWVRISDADGTAAQGGQEVETNGDVAGGLLVSWLRTTDTVVAVDNTQFFAILPDTEYLDALHVASSLESAIHRWKVPHGVRLIAKVGVSESSPEDESEQTALDRARQCISEQLPTAGWGNII